jgi:hypothetical protein
MQKKRRLGDRIDGRRLRVKNPIARISPYILKNRIGAQNLLWDEIEIDDIERYIREKRNGGLIRFGFMHVLVAAYIRTVSQRPGINRFISGQRLFSRNNIEVAMTVKKEMTAGAEDSIIKVIFEPTDTALDVYKKFDSQFLEALDLEMETGFEKAARIFGRLPGVILKPAVWLLNVMDYLGMLPRSLLMASPFHGSFSITSMGSLGIPPVFHHLYDFGNIPIFCAFGAKNTRYEMQKTGLVKQIRYIDITFVTDERICDGFYFASALKLFKRYLKNPYTLDIPPACVVEDEE